VVDEARGIAHEPSINYSLWTVEIVKTKIDTETLPKRIDTWVNYFSCIGHYEFLLLNDLSSKKTETCSGNSRPSNFYFLCSAHQNSIVFTFRTIIETAMTEGRFTLSCFVETGALLRPAILSFAVASLLPTRAVGTAQTFRKAVASFSTNASLAVFVTRILSNEVVAACCKGLIVLGLVNYFICLFSAKRFRLDVLTLHFFFEHVDFIVG